MNYSILTELGRGGMATVYLAEDKKFQTQVALKVLNKDLAHNENIRKRFLAEARNMYKMSHPNIIKVTDLIDEGDTVAFVMEHIDGETLKEYLDRKGKLSDDEIRNLFSQMLEAVGYVHEQGLVHRDIKPSNFMIDKKGKVKLLDFGIAKNTDTSSAEYTQTGTGMQMGTPMYMSPEQITETKSVTALSDIYSLGVVLWQLVTGERPYNTATLSTFQLQVKIVNEPLAFTGSAFDAVIKKATEKDPSMRFTDCHDFNMPLKNKSHSSIAEKTILFDVNPKSQSFNVEKVVIDESFPKKAADFLIQTSRELGLYEYVYNGEISLNTSLEYNLVHYEGLPGDFACFLLKINGAEILFAVYNYEWSIIFNGHQYITFKDIDALLRTNISNVSKSINENVFNLVSRFKHTEYFSKISHYINNFDKNNFRGFDDESTRLQSKQDIADKTVISTVDDKTQISNLHGNLPFANKSSEMMDKTLIQQNINESNIKDKAPLEELINVKQKIGTLKFIFKGVFSLIDVSVDVFVNEKLVLRGSFVNGFNFDIENSQTIPNIVIKHAFFKKNIEIPSLDFNKSYLIEIEYSRLWGGFCTKPKSIIEIN